MQVLNSEELNQLAVKHEANFFDVQLKATELRAHHSEIASLNAEQYAELLARHSHLGNYYTTALLWFVYANRNLDAYAMTDLLVALTLSNTKEINRQQEPFVRKERGGRRSRQAVHQE